MMKHSFARGGLHFTRWVFPSLLMALILSFQGFSQTDSSLQHEVIQIDTTHVVRNSDSIRAKAERAMDRNIKRFREKQQLSLQIIKLNLLRREAEKVENYFNKGIDTNYLKQSLSNLEDLYQVAVEGGIATKGEFQSYRNLTTSGLLLFEILQELESKNKTLGEYRSEVNMRQRLIDSLSVDSAIYKIPTDTAFLSDALQTFSVVIKSVRPADSLLKAASISLVSLDKRVINLRSNILAAITSAENGRKDLSGLVRRREFPLDFWNAEMELPLGKIIAASSYKGANTAFFFFENNKGKLAVLFILFVVVGILFSGLRKKLNQSKKDPESRINEEVLAFPFLSALFIIINVGQFLFEFPPYAIQALIFLMSTAILFTFRKKDFEIYESRLWNFAMLLSTFAILINFLVEPSVLEIFVLIALSICGVFLGLAFLKDSRPPFVNNRLLTWMLHFFIAIEFFSLLALILGRYNLGKTLLTSGYFGFASALYFNRTYQLLKEALNHYSTSLSASRNQAWFQKTKMLNAKAPGLIRVLLVFGWLIVLTRNFYFYSIAASFLHDFLSSTRSIGEYTYSFESVTTFILVILVSVIISNLVSTLSSDTGYYAGFNKKKKGGINNWLLLIRLAIVVTGSLLAFAAAGIPMDKLTIIIGSLGIGIGFGLQGIIGNLISGVILAFERPVEIGDQIEIAGRTGRIKEIGIRSSKMVNLDGAEVIIPNGDLLSNHVINWTLTNHQRRVEIIVGVKYGTNLSKTQEILLNILNQNQLIEKLPVPKALVHVFNSSSIDFRLLFWTDIEHWIDVKSEVILAIDKSFQEAGIEIPVPQQDIYIKGLPETGNETK